MSVNTITYTDKQQLNANASIPAINKCQAVDMNEIKSVVNTNANLVGDLTELNTTDKTSIVNAINEIKTPVVLYNNTSGSNAEITLSDSSANYEYIEIFYRNNNSVYSSLKVYQPNGKSVLLPCNIGNSGNQIWVQTSTWSISATNVSPVSTRSVQLSLTSSGVSSVSNTNQLYITRIIGYK